MTSHLYILFGEVPVKVFGPFFNLVVFLLHFEHSLYMLDNIPLSDISFANICFQLWLVFSLGAVFHRAEVFSIKSRLSIISFMEHAFGVVSKKSSSYPRSSRFCSILSFRSFIVAYFTFWSSFKFCEWYRVCVQTYLFIIFFTCGYSLVPALFCL